MDKLGRFELRAIEASVTQWIECRGKVGAQEIDLHANWLLMAVHEIRSLRARVAALESDQQIRDDVAGERDAGGEQEAGA